MKVDSSQFHIQHNAPQDGADYKLYTQKSESSFTDDSNYPRLSTDSDKVYAKAVRDKQSKNFILGSGFFRNFIMSAIPSITFTSSFFRTLFR